MGVPKFHLSGTINCRELPLIRGWVVGLFGASWLWLVSSLVGCLLACLPGWLVVGVLLALLRLVGGG